MKEDLTNRFAVLDLAIRESQFQKVQKELQQLKRTKISTDDVIRFASLCCRAGLPALGISKLKPIVRGGGRKKIQVLPQHLLEYSNCLMLIDAYRESEGILNSLDAKTYPDVHKIQAYINIREWNYHLAIPHLKNYIQTLPSGDYASTVSKLNLAMSLIFEGTYNEAAGLLNEIISGEENFRFKNLKGNCYRLLGVLEFNRANYEVAIQCLQKAYSIFGEPDGLDAFLVRKWIAITQYFMQKGSVVSKIMLDSILQEAVVRRHWETIRDIDYHCASFHQDEALLIRLYFGTSYRHFKERLLKHFPKISIPHSYIWKMGKSPGTPTKCFSLDESNLKPGQSGHKLMAVLTSDFYRTFNTVDFFQRIYPGELYRLIHSEQKVHQVVTRLRRQFVADKLPFIIESTGNLFRLTSASPIEVTVRDQQQPIDSQRTFRLQEITANFGDRPFSVSELMALFGLARATAAQFANHEVVSGTFIQTRSGKRNAYRLSAVASFEDKEAA